MIRDLSEHCSYLGFDPHLKPFIPKYMRSGKTRISKLLEQVDFLAERKSHDYHLLPKARPLNGNGFLARFLSEHDCRIYLSEVDAKTKSSKELVADFVKFCKRRKLPRELAEVTFAQLYRDEDANVVISSPPVVVDTTQDVASMICLALPSYVKDKAKVNTLIREFAEIAVADGYFLSNYDVVYCNHMDGLEECALIAYLTFEAKYTTLDIKLESNLFHVTTEDALASVAKNGLVPKSWSSEFEYSPRVFLFNRANYDLILKYGVEKAKSKGKSQFYVLRVDKKSIESYQPFKSGEFVLYRDPAFSLENDKTDQTAIFTYDPIPRELIADTVARYEVGSVNPTMMKLN